MAAGKFVRAVAKLLAALGEQDCAVAGGMAVNAHGYLRGTRDVDIIVSIPLEEARRRLKAHGIETRLFKGDPFEGDFPCLKGVVGVETQGRGPIQGVAFDILPQLVPIEPEKALDLVVRGQRLRVVDMETLIRLKLKAGSPADLFDVAILVNLHPGWKGRAKGLAVHNPQLAQRLVSMIEDPRTRAKAMEAKRQEAALRDFARRMAARRDDRT